MKKISILLSIVIIILLTVSAYAWMQTEPSLGENIEYNSVVNSIDFDTKTVRTADGKKYQAQVIITTIPWMEFREIKGMPDDIVQKWNLKNEKARKQLLDIFKVE